MMRRTTTRIPSVMYDTRAEQRSHSFEMHSSGEGRMCCTSSLLSEIPLRARETEDGMKELSDCDRPKPGLFKRHAFFLFYARI